MLQFDAPASTLAENYSDGKKHNHECCRNRRILSLSPDVQARKLRQLPRRGPEHHAKRRRVEIVFGRDQAGELAEPATTSDPVLAGQASPLNRRPPPGTCRRSAARSGLGGLQRATHAQSVTVHEPSVQTFRLWMTAYLPSERTALKS